MNPNATDPRRVLVGVMLVLLLGAINQTIVAVALPRIAERLDGFGLIAWVISGYLVAATVVTPIYGKLFDRHGVRIVLAGAISVFAVGSLGCALSTSMPMLVAFRVLQGVGGGGLISGAHAAIAQTVSPRERGRYQAYFSSMFALASVLGPVAGGWLTDVLSWQWVFAANLPLSLAALWVIRERLRPLPIPGRRSPIDALGALLLSIGLAALLIAITRAGQGKPWLDAQNVGWLVSGAVLLAGYAWREHGVADPVLPLPLLRNRIVALGLMSQFLGHGLMITLTVMVPLELQLVAGLAPAAAAWHLIALSMGPPVGSMIAGRTMSATGRYRPQQSIGALGNALAVFALAAAIGFDAPDWVAGTLLFVAGVGFGLQFPTTLVAIQSAAPAEHLGATIAAVNFVRSLGGAIGIALLSTMLLELLRYGAPELAGEAAGADVMRALTETGADALRERMQPVAEHAFIAIFVTCGLTSLVVLGLFRAMPERTLRG
ncbi:MAG: MFS transporter [Burkholderiales bacterium]|nr:MAG: MFS transporter [Burkholderiales bacterium]